ncbi:MAG: recombinase family protein [Eubacteriales bacterium]|nr:recombinase family protein [Eubacteriales bacterium]
MKENEEKLTRAAEQKEKIRQRYKGIDVDELDIIPALPQTNFYEDKREKRVAVYARVSTDDPRQTSSYELQKNHYQDVVSRHPGWNLIEIYADEGISGTSLQHRDAFMRMINDCHAGKIDLIVTKSVSRFARNVLDCIGYVRKLAALNPPIGIFFETENIYTLNPNSEMSLSFISTLAQEESHNKSEIMNASIEMRFRRGIFLTPPLLGYDHDEDGNLVINEEEAKTVRLIFFMYLYGYTCQEIANTLTKLECRTKKNNTRWSSSTILQVLQNERHCGDVLARKTWTPNFLDHKSKKNKQNRNQYRQRNHHEAIISRDDFIAVQRLINNAKYGNKGILPELTVITEGFLRGYVSVNPRWSGFKAIDYQHASESAYDSSMKDELPELTANEGDFDYRGYEIARSQFFDTSGKLYITFSSSTIKFSIDCIKKLETSFIELLVNPLQKAIVVRSVSKDEKNAISWSRTSDGKIIAKPISGNAYLPNLFELFEWSKERKYRIVGEKKQLGNQNFLIFHLDDTEILISKKNLANDIDESKATFFDDNLEPLTINQSIVAFPSSWTHTFGNNYYVQAQANEMESIFMKSEKNMSSKESPYHPEPPLNVTSKTIIRENIKQIIDDLKQEETNESESHN